MSILPTDLAQLPLSMSFRFNVLPTPPAERRSKLSSTSTTFWWGKPASYLAADGEQGVAASTVRQSAAGVCAGGAQGIGAIAHEGGEGVWRVWDFRLRPAAGAVTLAGWRGSVGCRSEPIPMSISGHR